MHLYRAALSINGWAWHSECVRLKGIEIVESKTFKVPAMSCNGCVSTVRAELEQINGVEVIDISKATQLVTVQWQQPVSWNTIEKALTDIEYAPVEA